MPSPRETAWLLRRADTDPVTLRPEQQDYARALCATCPALAQARTLAREFTRVLD